LGVVDRPSLLVYLYWEKKKKERKKEIRTGKMGGRERNSRPSSPPGRLSSLLTIGKKRGKKGKGDEKIRKVGGKVADG